MDGLLIGFLLLQTVRNPPWPPGAGGLGNERVGGSCFCLSFFNICFDSALAPLGLIIGHVELEKYKVWESLTHIIHIYIYICVCTFLPFGSPHS
jgi:hypothetical protein